MSCYSDPKCIKVVFAKSAPGSINDVPVEDIELVVAEAINQPLEQILAHVVS